MVYGIPRTRSDSETEDFIGLDDQTLLKVGAIIMLKLTMLSLNFKAVSKVDVYCSSRTWWLDSDSNA